MSTAADVTSHERASEIARRAAIESEAAFAHRYHYRLLLSITGRIRFLSHLETVDTLLGAIRRSGVRIALSEGMRPKPRIKVAMPRPVAAEAWADVVEIELQHDVDPAAFARALASVLPSGMQLGSVERVTGSYTSAASQVTGASWRWTFAADEVDRDELERGLASMLAAPTVLVERSSPRKRSRHIDVRSFVAAASLMDPGTPDVEEHVIRADIRLTPEGSAKPEEFVRALRAYVGRDLRPVRTTRESIALADGGERGHGAEPALVGPAETVSGRARLLTPDDPERSGSSS